MQQLLPTLELVLMDESGSTAAVVVHLQSGSTVAAADVAASALASVVASVTGCVLVKQRLIYRAVNDTSTPAAIGSSILRCGVFIFNTVSDMPLGLVQVPGIRDSILDVSGFGAGVIIDETNTDVITFVGALLDSDASNPFADVFASLDIAYLQSRV